jgi:hypothetical protein
MGVDQLVHNVYPKNIFRVSPGLVGSVGDVVVKPRFRQSTPFMPWAYDPYYEGKRADSLGSNVQDGYSISNVSLGGPGRTIDASFEGNRGLKHQYGFSVHDLMSISKSTQPVLYPIGDISLKRRVASTRIAKRTGAFFGVKPQPYMAAYPRGGSNVRVTDVLGGEGNGVIDQRDVAISRDPRLAGGNNAGASVPGVQNVRI